VGAVPVLLKASARVRHQPPATRAGTRSCSTSWPRRSSTPGSWT
jgi:hypothetical protein